MKSIKTSVEKKLFFMSVIFLTVVATIIGFISYMIYRKDSIQYNAERALSIAQTVASSINAEEFVEIINSNEKTPYWYETLDFANKVYTESGALYLYILGNINNQNVTYFIDAYDETYIDPVDLGSTEESSVHGDELFETYRSGVPAVTDIYDFGGYGMMVSGYAAIKDSVGNSVGIVGMDISLLHIEDKVSFFGLQIIVIALCLNILFGLLALFMIRRMVGNPVRDLTYASEQLANGESEIRLNVKSEDEIGKLTKSFQALSAATKKQIEAVQRIAKGDYSFIVTPRSERDFLNIALKKVLDENNMVFEQIQNAALQTASVSEQVASGAQNLALGSAEQATSTVQLASAVSEVLTQTKENADNAQEALNFINDAGMIMQSGLRCMEELKTAMRTISESSGNISKIIKTIDDIAFQTNILSLNAAVEAERAGLHGKGFAVVADEVRNLASKSAQAAKETAVLIHSSVEQVEQGERIVTKTSESIQNVAISAQKAQGKIERINNAAKKQEESIQQINIGVERISQVVQANNATSEESVATSEEMSSQADLLFKTVARFRLQNQRAI